MTIAAELNHSTAMTGTSLPLAFESGAAELAGIRVLPAQFAKLMGVSKQAVTEWKKAGRITIGIDGRIDPRQAVAQLLRTGDPHRMRSKILAPLMDEVHKRDRRIAELETALAESREDVEFHESSSLELLEIIDALKVHLELNWGDLLALPASEGLAAVLAWIEAAIVRGGDHGSIIPNLSAFNEADLDFSALYEAEKEGEESARKSISEPGAPE